jgi:hypothetical protein
MSDESGAVRLNPDAEALLGFTAAVSNFAQSLGLLTHIVVTKELDDDFVAEVKATTEAIMKRFRNEIEQGMTIAIPKGAFVFDAPGRAQ